MFVYVNWKLHEVLPEDAYEGGIRKERIDEIINDNDLFLAWLNKNYSASEIFCDDTRWEADDRWREEVAIEEADRALADEGWEMCELD